MVKQTIKIETKDYIRPSMSFKDLYYKKSVIITISMPFDLLEFIEDMVSASQEYSRASIVSWLIHMGKAYSRVLADRQLEVLDHGQPLEEKTASKTSLRQDFEKKRIPKSQKKLTKKRKDGSRKGKY